MPHVSIIILNWNGWKNTVDCLKSLYEISYSNFKVILVDNGSTDNSVEIIKKWVNQKRIKISLVLNKKNEGFVGGNNIAINRILKEGKSEYILLLNNDTVVDKNFLTELIETAEQNEDIAIVGPKIYFLKPQSQRKIIESVGGSINLFTGSVIWYGEKQTDQGQYEKVREVDYVEGACLLIKSKVIKKIGPLSEKLFAYFEDVDWCLRTKENQYKVVCVPKAFIWHKGGESSKKMPELGMYYRVRNRFLIEKRYANSYQYIFFICYYLLIMIPLWTFRSFILLKRPGLMKYFFQGLRDGFSVKFLIKA